MFYCHVKIKIPLSISASDIIDHCFYLMDDIDRSYNSYAAGSYFDRINNNPGEWIRVDNNTNWLLNELNRIRDLTEGIYNIEVMPLLRTWGFYQEQGLNLPQQREIDQILDRIGKKGLEMNGNQVRTCKGSELITGSFIKAFAVDQVVDFLRNEGVTDAMINAGGSTIYAMNDEDHQDWKVNIPHPTLSNHHWLELPLRNSCLSLSGRKNHFIEINNKSYSHVINARTGYPSSNHQAVTITPSAFMGDVLSTALMANDQDLQINMKLEQAFKGQLSYYVVPENVPNSAPNFILC